MTTRKNITTEEFERRFEAGEDIRDLVDWSKGKRLHGGKRPGSGRKSTGRKAYTVRLRPECHEQIQRRAQKKGISLSEYIEEMVISEDSKGTSYGASRGSTMSKKQGRTVFRGDDGQWKNKRNDASRAASSHPTQREAEQAARQMLRKQGGGELTTKGRDGKIRCKDPIPPRE